MTLQLGKSPDFRLTRNNQLIAHHLTITQGSDGRAIDHRVVVNVSLVMCRREINRLRDVTFQVMRCYAISQIEEGFSAKFSTPEQSTELEGIFRLPGELTQMQRSTIKAFLTRYFGFHQ